MKRKKKYIWAGMHPPQFSPLNMERIEEVEFV